MQKQALILLLFISPIILISQQATAQTNLYTLVDGMLLSPTRDARTAGKNSLRFGVSGYYYRYNSRPNISSYFPYPIVNPIQDALINVAAAYGVLDKTEISLIIPCAPDWLPDQGANLSGFADIVLQVKQYLSRNKSINSGILLAFKFNSSSQGNNPFWYGTNCPNIFTKLVLSTHRSHFSIFGNIGFKKVIGAGKRFISRENRSYTYSNTWIGAIGFYLPVSKKFSLGVENNFESPNKKEINGYYLDCCAGFILSCADNFQISLKIGRNITSHAPDIFIDSGCSISAGH